MNFAPDEIQRLLTNFSANPGVTEASIRRFEETAGVVLPYDYHEFLSHSNGGEGFVAGNYLVIWQLEIIAEMNLGYQVSEFASGLLLFGSNGGGEGYAFDRRLEEYSIVSVPFAGMNLDTTICIAPDFSAFLRGRWKARP